MNISKKNGKEKESIQSSTTPDPKYHMRSEKITIRHHKQEPRGKPFSQQANISPIMYYLGS